MRVGIYLGDFSPDVGGGYTFQDEVFRAFLKVSAHSAHQFVVMGTAKQLISYVRSIPHSLKCKVIVIRVGNFNKYLETLKNYSPLLRKLLPKGPIERAAKDTDLDFLWFVAGGPHEAPDIPYIATVWDLQHRLTPWFPEMSANGNWDAREAAHKRFLQRASFIITGTKVGQCELNLCYQVAESRVKILPHPTPTFTHVDIQASDILIRLKISEPYLLYPAQFWPHKNHANLIHALAILRDVHSMKIPLVLVGSEKGNIAYIKSMVQDLKLSEQVHFAGFVSQSELVDLYRGASMLAYTSFCGPENLPPLEAFSLGCPVLAADVPGSQEQLGNAALFFNPADPADLANKVKELFVDTDLRSRLIGRGVLRARSWTAENFGLGILGLCDEFSAIRRCWANSEKLMKI